MLIATGASSNIVRALKECLPHGEPIRSLPLVNRSIQYTKCRYLFCHGAIASRSIRDQSEKEIAESFFVNCARTIQLCDEIISHDKEARICIVGSESGFTWSFDGTYAASKAAIHRYVETKRLLHTQQQLVAIAPTIISDAGMTLRRTDKDRVATRAATHPKGRFLRSCEVAKLIHFLLYEDEGYISGVVIRMNGGEHTRR